VLEVNVENDGGNRISKFHDEDDEIDLRVTGSFHIKPQPMEGSSTSQAALQGSSRRTAPLMRPAADPDAPPGARRVPQKTAGSFLIPPTGLPGHLQNIPPRSFAGHNDQKRFGFDG